MISSTLAALPLLKQWSNIISGMPSCTAVASAVYPYEILCCTKSFAAHQNKSMNDVLQRPLLQMIAPSIADHTEAKNDIHQSIQRVISQSHEDEVVLMRCIDRKNSRVEYEKISHTLILDNDGRVQCLLQTITAEPFQATAQRLSSELKSALPNTRSEEDIIAENKLRQMIADAECRLSNAIELAELGTWELDIETMVSTFSTRLRDWWGFSSVTAPLQEIIACVHADDRALLPSCLERAQESGQYAAEYRVINKITGQKRFIEARGVLTLAEDGKPKSLSGIVRDVTFVKMNEDKLDQLVNRRTRELAQSHREIKISSERLQAIFNHAQIAIFMFSPVTDTRGEIIDFRFTLCNSLFASYVAQAPTTLVGDLGSRWFPGYMANGIFDMYKRTYITGEVEQRNFHYHVDGHDLHLNIRSAKAGEEVLITFTDHTALKSAQIRLENTIDELKRSNENLRQFSYAASHDMQEPLRKIATFSNVLRTQYEHSLDGRGQALLEKMETSSNRMRSIIDDLLEYSHAATEGHRLEEVDLNQVIRDIEINFEITLEEKNAFLCVGYLPKIKAIPHQISQLFTNLISNGLKFQKQHASPRITIEAEVVDSRIIDLENPAADQYVVISVSDNGIGFPSKYSEQIFQLFTRLHRKDEFTGTGVGLALCKKIMENHGGTIWIESREEAGSCFYMGFPC